MSLGLEQVSIDKHRELGTMSICYVIRIRTSVDRQALFCWFLNVVVNY